MCSSIKWYLVRSQQPFYFKENHLSYLNLSIHSINSIIHIARIITQFQKIILLKIRVLKYIIILSLSYCFLKYTAQNIQSQLRQKCLPTWRNFANCQKRKKEKNPNAILQIKTHHTTNPPESSRWTKPLQKISKSPLKLESRNSQTAHCKLELRPGLRHNQIWH